MIITSSNIESIGKEKKKGINYNQKKGIIKIIKKELLELLKSEMFIDWYFFNYCL